jgi:hypothetical protein
MINKCTKSHNGKHDWTYEIQTDSFGNKTRYRRCDYCHMRQRYVGHPDKQSRWRII